MRQRANQPARMRIIIAGAGGFARVLVRQISQTAHSLLVLSRRVAVLDYGNVEDLRYMLRGVDLVISTIAGNEQLSLIDAARLAHVRVFVPSEFEGDLSHRPSDDPLDRGSQSALNLLEQWSQSSSYNMRYTVFSCGIFMERFAPGGLARYQTGAGCGVQGPDDYLVNVQERRAEIVQASSQISMTSMDDVARLVTAAVELGLDSWPKEFRMKGDSMTAQDLVRTCSTVRGVPFSIVARHCQEAEAQAEDCQQYQDWAQWHYWQRLLQTADGRYHVRQANLNAAVDVHPVRFRTWLERNWGSAARHPYGIIS